MNKIIKKIFPALILSLRLVPEIFMTEGAKVLNKNENSVETSRNIAS